MSAVAMNYPKYESYKDSGIDWLGEIPSDWQSKKLGVLLTEFSKKNNPNMPLLSITRNLGVITRDMDDQESNHNFIPDDLSGYKLLKEGQFGINKMKAWQGSYGISKYTGIVSPAYYVFDVSNEIYPNFFNIAIRSKFYVDFFGSASDGVRIGQWDLNKTRMREIPFIFPSLEQQKKIYEFLSKKIKQIDQAIALKQQQIDKLNEYKQIVIQNAVTKGLNPNVLMKDSGVEWIGDIPEHWEVKKLKYIGKIKNGMDYKHVEAESGYPVIGSGGQFTFASKYIYDGEAVLLGRKGTIDKPLYINDKFWTVDTMFYCICKRLYSTKFIYYCAITIPFHYYSTATALPSMTQSDLNNHKFAMPSLSEQIEIIDYLETTIAKFDKVSQKYQTQIDRLKEYKNILINQAVTGKIKID